MTKKITKISVVGAGQVGATLAQRIIEGDLADVILVDICGNIARGKALDLLDASPIIPHDRTIIGTDDFSLISSSDIVVITAGLPRKPGMTREDLISKNADIVRGVSDNIKSFAPSSIVIVVTNPLDTMTYHANKTCGFGRNRIFGMAGELDGSRMAALIASELHIPRSSVKACVMGSHGDTMVPVISNTKADGRPISDLLSKDKLDGIIRRTKDRGLEIVNLLGTGSAYYSPSAAVFKMIKAILSDSGDTIVASVLLNGEYGLDDICIGVPCKIGREGVREIVSLDLSSEEKTSLMESAKAIKGSIKLL